MRTARASFGEWIGAFLVSTLLILALMWWEGSIAYARVTPLLVAFWIIVAVIAKRAR